MPHNRQVLRLNVGFLINTPVGTSRDFYLDVPELRWDEPEPSFRITDVTGSARVTRTAQGLLVQVKMKAFHEMECVRCLTSTTVPLSIDFTELYAFNKDSITDSGLLLPESAHIDLAPLVREYMLLEIPISPLCREDCKGLCPVCGENLNEKLHTHDDEPVDPRLEKLKEFRKKD
jgi:uncharacterized protein